MLKRDNPTEQTGRVAALANQLEGQVRFGPPPATLNSKPTEETKGTPESSTKPEEPEVKAQTTSTTEASVDTEAAPSLPTRPLANIKRPAGQPGRRLPTRNPRKTANVTTGEQDVEAHSTLESEQLKDTVVDTTTTFSSTSVSPVSSPEVSEEAPTDTVVHTTTVSSSTSATPVSSPEVSEEAPTDTVVHTTTVSSSTSVSPVSVSVVNEEAPIDTVVHTTTVSSSTSVSPVSVSVVNEEAPTDTITATPSETNETPLSSSTTSTPYLSSSGSGLFQSSPGLDSENLKKKFLLLIQAKFEAKANWEVRFGGGTPVNVKGNEVVMPDHAAQMYELCKDVTDATSDDDVETKFKAVETILDDAQHGSSSDNIFTWLWKLLKRTIARSTDTQAFYDEAEQSAPKAN